jgi:predicted RNase H-like HicB family nuclease
MATKLKISRQPKQVQGQKNLSLKFQNPLKLRLNMKSKVSIEIKKTAKGYLAYSPEIEGFTAQGNSLDSVIDTIKEVIHSYWEKKEPETSKTTGQSLLELFENITSDMTEEESKNLPRDGAEQHDHYIYGIPKRDS